MRNFFFLGRLGAQGDDKSIPAPPSGFLPYLQYNCYQKPAVPLIAGFFYSDNSQLSSQRMVLVGTIPCPARWLSMTALLYWLVYNFDLGPLGPKVLKLAMKSWFYHQHQSSNASV